MVAGPHRLPTATLPGDATRRTSPSAKRAGVGCDLPAAPLWPFAFTSPSRTYRVHKSCSAFRGSGLVAGGSVAAVDAANARINDSPGTMTGEANLTTVHGISSSNSPLAAAKIVFRALLVRGLSYGPGFSVDEVVHDHEIASRSMVAVRHVGRVRAKRSVSRLDVDGRHKRRWKLDADE